MKFLASSHHQMEHCNKCRERRQTFYYFFFSYFKLFPPSTFCKKRFKLKWSLAKNKKKEDASLEGKKKLQHQKKGIIIYEETLLAAVCEIGTKLVK